MAAFVRDSFEDDPCATIGASLERVEVQPRVPLADFLVQANQSAEGYGARQLAQRVNAVFADVAIDGYRGDHLTLKWSMFDAKTGRIVRKPALRNRPALDIEPSTCETRLRAAIWTPIDRTGARRVSLTIVDEDGHVLAEARTPRV
ncbi:MAG TPA: hypothetical protein VFR32_09030 [Gaiellaceae bacterium]|nr:hypothetical protein [Gaiellaceae bacterium]